MTLFKCKMCGGTLEVNNNETVLECEYCGTKQTLPRLDDDRRANLYDRANHFRRNNEFDKAMGIYEQILNEDNTDAEAYWSLVLCRYGIEYVEDPATRKRIPTVNRAQFTSIFDDDNYKSALQYADLDQKIVYEEEAKTINEIQKGILAISQKEEPFDVFICYKETDNNGRRTQDSVLANDLYHQLTQEGFKVFFSRITLEDKLGTAYEPYIFAALNSAKVMVVLGTKAEYFNAVWVKNEWSRFLSLIKSGEKKTLIPAYRDMDPYDLPEEFSHLQAQDMSKLGFMQDLIRGIKKIAKSDEPVKTVVRETVVSTAPTNNNIAPLLERAFMFLEDEDWDSADEYCEKVLDVDPKNAQAYLGKLMAELMVPTREELADYDQLFDDNSNYKKAMRFGDENLRVELQRYTDEITEYLNEEQYDKATSLMKNGETENSESYLKRAAQMFEELEDYRDSEALAKECREYLEGISISEELFKAYKSAVKNEAINKNKKTVEEKLLSGLIEQQKRLLQIKGEWDDIKETCDTYYREIQSVHNTILKLNNEKANLGLFAGKKKKELDEKIKTYEREMQSLKQERIAAESQKGGFMTLDLLCDKIQNIEEQISVHNKKINELSDVKSARSSEEIREELCGYSYGRQLFANYNPILSADVGDYIKLGRYNRLETTEIEWLVLDKKNNKVLIISKNAFDEQKFHTDLANITWGTCTLRKWLNSDFMLSVFTDEDEKLIQTTNVPAHKNPKYNTNPGNTTEDQVFLLSIEEVSKYFDSDSSRKCNSADGNYSVGWWLRSPGGANNHCSYVASDGRISEYGGPCASVNYIRPALWIDLTKMIEQLN